jgi:hypothetical protein
MSYPLFRLVAQPVAFGWAGVTKGWESDHSHLLGEPVSGYSLTFDGLCRIGNRHWRFQLDVTTQHVCDAAPNPRLIGRATQCLP